MVTAVANSRKKSIKSSAAKVEGVCEKKKEKNDGVKEMEEDIKNDEKSQIQKMEVDSEGKEDGQSRKEQGAREREEEVGTKKKKRNDKVSNQAKPPRRHESKKISAVEHDSSRNEVEEKKEIKTLTVSANRPVRERKSVQRLVTSIEREPVKEFCIEKGNGSALKDIPNVAYKLSKRKTDGTLKLLHTILFGRRAKAAQVKSNISLFSGYVWNENEEKQKIKVKEKLDKCIKEKLVEFCDVLDLPTPKVNTRKEDIVAKLIDFLVAPHATSSELLAEKKQGTKRKRIAKPGAPSKKSSLKNRKRNEDLSNEREEDDTPGTEIELDDKEKEAEDKELGIEETSNGNPESKVSHSASKENKDESGNKPEDDACRIKKGPKTSSAKKEIAGKGKRKKVSSPKKSSKENKDESGDKPEDDTSRIKKEPKKSSAKKEIAEKGKGKEVSSPKKSSSIKKTISLKSASKSPKVNEINDVTSKASSKKKTEVAKENASRPEKSRPKEKPGKKGGRAKAKIVEEKSEPSDEALKAAVCEILKESDFNKVTFGDILKLLAERFETDITSRKSSIKTMVKDELARIANEADDDEDDDEDENKRVKA